MLAVHLALLAVQILFATLSVVAKRYVLPELPPFGMAAIRASLATACLWGVALARGKWRVPRADLLPLVGLAALGITANQLLFIAGLDRTSATMALVLGTSIPVFTVGLAIALRREAPSRDGIAGVALGLGGVVLAIGPSGGGHVGDVLILCNSLAYALYLVLGKSVVLRTDPLVMTTWVITFGAMMVLPFGADDAAGAIAHLSWHAWLGLAWIILGCTVGTYTLNAWALARAPASLVATYIYVQPVIGAGLAAVLLGERPGWTTIAGGGLIAAGIWMVTRRLR